MLEIYCDSSYNENEVSYIGCTVLRKGNAIHQSTTRVPGSPKNNLDCELAALDFAVSLARLFFAGDREIVIYNDSTEAVKAFQSKGPEFEREFQNAGAGLETSPFSHLSFEYVPREKAHQAAADSLSKKFPVVLLDVPTLDVESFSRREDILSDIARNGRSVFYLQNEREKSTKSRTCYRLVIRSIDNVLSDDRLYLIKKGGPGTQVKAAEMIRNDLSDPEIRSSLESKGVRLENSYFLLTDETWGLRLTDNRAYSILPSEFLHRIICDEVDRAPENLFRRTERFR